MKEGWLTKHSAVFQVRNAVLKIDTILDSLRLKNTLCYKTVCSSCIKMRSVDRCVCKFVSGILVNLLY